MCIEKRYDGRHDDFIYKLQIMRERGQMEIQKFPPPSGSPPSAEFCDFLAIFRVNHRADECIREGKLCLTR